MFSSFFQLADRKLGRKVRLPYTCNQLQQSVRNFC
jgi:hypothetical protein